MKTVKQLAPPARAAGGMVGRIALMFACLVFAAGTASADIIDLTTAGADGTHAAAIGGSFYVQQIDPQSTGTGVIDPFVRIQGGGSTDMEEGYNTGLGTPLDTLGGVFTRPLLLSEIPLVEVDGVLYRQFVLDINESSGGDSELISLNQIQIFQAGADMLHTGLASATASTQPIISFASAVEIFRMNNAADTTHGILLDYSLNSGSGSGDMFLYVLASSFNASPYVIFYSQFGTPAGLYSNSDGFEEWSVLQGSVPVPEPATLALFGLALTACGMRMRRNRKTA